MRDGWEARAMQDLLNEIQKAGAPPCQGCPLAAQCVNGMACWDFAFYCDRNLRRHFKLRDESRSRVPSREMYAYVFPAVDPIPGDNKALPTAMRRELDFVV